jgi:uncharacterized protein (TIGR02001 family)
MKQVKVLAALGLMGLAGVANAGVTSTITATNDYDFRGITQSSKDPALQASLDYAHDSGFSVGAWASNVDFGDTPKTEYELDLYAGFAKTLDSGFGWSAGVVDYTYSRHTYDYIEVYGGVSYKWVGAKIFYSPKFGGDYAKGLNSGNDVSAMYFSVDATVPLPANFSILGHVGRSSGNYWDDINLATAVDYSAGVGYALSNFNFALKYVKTKSDSIYTTDAFNNEGRVILTVATTLPWK